MTHRRLRFAVLTDYAISSYQAKLRAGIDRYIENAGIDAVFFGMGLMNPDSGEDRSKETFFDFITPDAFDGVIAVSAALMTASNKEVVKARLEALRPLPVVSIGPSVMGEDGVIVDNRSGLSSMMAHLIEGHGYRDFAYVSGPVNHLEAGIRLEAFHDALAAAGIDHDERRVYLGNFLISSGEAAVTAFLDERSLSPQVIVCANDLMTMGAWKALRARGLDVPHDIALTGYDDMQVLRSVTHQFTTIRQNFVEQGYVAAERLHGLILGVATEPLAPLANELVIRSSCGCVRIEGRESTKLQDATSAAMREIRDRLVAVSREHRTDGVENQIIGKWIKVVLDAIDEGRPIYSLENLLREARESVHKTAPAGAMESLLANLHVLLLEECGHSEIIEHWGKRERIGALQSAVAGLRRELTHEPAPAAHDDRYAEIAARSGAKIFILIEFTDQESPEGGAKIVYSLDNPDLPPDWIPGHGVRLPSVETSLVVNMICFDDRRFGYLIIDAGLVAYEAYQYLAENLSALFKDYVAVRNIKELNREMSREIAAREESELKLKKALAMVEKLSIVDELTGLNNRRGFLTLSEQQIKYLRRERAPFFLIFIDIDGLKSINDRWGHKEGDAVIQAAADVIRKAMRESDIVARLGGDEFTVLAGRTNMDGFGAIKKRLADLCEKWNGTAHKPWKLSMSVGGYLAEGDSILDVKQMMELADAELYKEKQRKRAGRKSR